MALTQMDENAALVVIDLQKGLMGLPAIHPVKDIVERTARLARAFRSRELPVVLVNVAGRPAGRTELAAPKFSLPPDWTELVPELGEQPTDIRITKCCIGAFHGTTLDEALRALGVTQLFLTGVSTHVGVESTGRSAYDLGYNCVFVLDAMTDRDEAAHLHSVQKVFPRLGETTTTDEVLKRFSERPASSQFMGNIDSMRSS